MAEIYNNLDGRIIDLYHSYLDKIPHLRRALALLAGVSVPEDLAELTETDEDEEKEAAMDAWDVAQLLWGTSVYPLLLQNDRFAEFSALAQRARDFVEEGATEPLRNFITRLKSATRLDPLFEKLVEIKSAEQLEQITDERLQELAGHLIGVAFEELKKSELNNAVKALQENLNLIEEFKNDWYARVTEAVSHKFTFDLHYAFTRASRNRGLIDVELNLNRHEGRELARAAAAGDFSGALENYNSKYVRVNDGVFTHELDRSARLQINVMGRDRDRIRKLSQIVEHSIEPSRGGLLHIYAIDTSTRQLVKKGRKFKEVIESNFLLRSMGESFQNESDPSVDSKTRRYLVQTINNLAAQYDLLESDDHTSAEELKRYLDLAEFLGLFEKQSRESFVSDLASQFPDGFGKVKISYVVRYNNAVLRDALSSVSGDELRELARQTMRRLIGAKYTGMKRTEWLARVGFAYLSPSLHEVFDREGSNALRQFKTVTLPAWFTRDAPLKVELSSSDIQFLITLCSIEQSYADRLVKLDQILDRVFKDGLPIPLDELMDAARKFIEMADDLDEWRENAFFAIFDKVVETSLKKAPETKAVRESAMTLEITPFGKNKVTKVMLQRN